MVYKRTALISSIIIQRVALKGWLRLQSSPLKGQLLD